MEEEQHGENRAAYGRQLLKELSAFLTKNYGKGYSAENADWGGSRQLPLQFHDKQNRFHQNARLSSARYRQSSGSPTHSSISEIV